MDSSRLSKLCLLTFAIGDQILFCPKCDWQNTTKQGMYNQCPECGDKGGLRVVRINQELKDITTRT